MIKLGVIGAGHIGKIHFQCIKQVKELELVGFYDNNPKVRSQVAKEFSIKSFESIDELIEASEALDIVTPTIAHFESASKALKKSKHVFIEKPIVATPKQAEDLINIANEANVKVQVGHVERFNPALTAARPFINKPIYIESHRISRFKQRGSDVPVVLDMMIHDIDIVLHIVKSKVKKIKASGVSIISDTPDVANARIEFYNGCVANLTASRVSENVVRKTRFFQQDSFITVDFLDKKTEIIRLANPLVDNFDNGSILESIAQFKNEKGQQNLCVERPIVFHTNAIVDELESFAKSIINNHDPIVTIDDGNEALVVAHQILETIESNNLKNNIN